MLLFFMTCCAIKYNAKPFIRCRYSPCMKSICAIRGIELQHSLPSLAQRISLDGLALVGEEKGMPHLEYQNGDDQYRITVSNIPYSLSLYGTLSGSVFNISSPTQPSIDPQDILNGRNPVKQVIDALYAADKELN